MLEECRCKWWSDSLQVYAEKFFFPVEESYAEFAIKAALFFTIKVVVINPHTIQKKIATEENQN